MVKKMIKKIFKIIFIITLLIIAIYSSVILIQKIVLKDKTPSVFGIKNYIILSGSMEPTISEGDVVFVQKTNDIEKNDIVSYRFNNSVITHRVIEVTLNENNEKQFKTKGDANLVEDDVIVNIENIEGKYLFKIKKIGKVILFLKNNMEIVILVFIAFVAFIGSLFINRRKDQNDNEINAK